MRGTTKVRAHLWTALAALPLVCAASCPEQLERSVDGMYVSGRDSASVTLGLIYLAVPTGAVGARGGPDETDAPVCPPFWTPDDPRPSPARTVCPRRDADYEVWAVGGGVHEGPITVPATRLGPVTSSDPSDPREIPAPAPPPPPPPPPVGPPAVTRAAGWPQEVQPLRARPDTVRPAVQRTVRTGNVADLERAIASARAGDEILLAPGASYTRPGGFTLPPRNDGGWVVIRTDIRHPMVRVDTTANLAEVSCTGGGCAPLTVDQPGDHGWRLELIEVVAPDGTNAAVRIHAGGTDPPRRIVLDRIYVRGEAPMSQMRRAVLGNAASVAVLRSALTGAQERGTDTQAFVAWNSPGPFLIYDNLLVGASENILIGGADPPNEDLIPADIEIARNHFFKPLAWRRSPWVVKNLLELKISKRVHIWGNVFENHWRGAQAGYAILFKSTNQSGGFGDFSVTEDVYFERNILRNVDMGFNLARQTEGARRPMSRVLIENVLIERLGPDSDFGDGTSRTFMIQGPDDLTIRNVTSLNDRPVHSILEFETMPGNTAVIENMLTGPSEYGVRVRARYRSLRMDNNIATRDSCSNYGSGWTCMSRPPAGFGADLDAVRAATAGVVRP